MTTDPKPGKNKQFFRSSEPEPSAAKPVWPALAGDLEALHTEGSTAPGSAAAKQRHIREVEEARRLLDTIEAAVQDRVQAAHRVEEMLDQGRAGSYSSQGIESVVAEILSHGSIAAMKAIAGLKGSDQTYAHCADMAAILQDSYAEMLVRQGKTLSEANSRFILIAGFVHDIGKSEVPKEILDSPHRFAPDSPEMRIMRNHATYGARIVAEMGMHPIAVNMAHYHHVKRNTSLFASYPVVDYEQVLPITRLASIADVYQALIGRRRYKKDWVSGKAIEYLRALRGTDFDEAILDNFIAGIGLYPVGALLRLSTRELAFVLRPGPRDHADRPLVAVVENAAGELLTHHTVVDLMVDVDVRVEEVVDHYEHYNQSEDHALQVFQSIRIAA